MMAYFMMLPWQHFWIQAISAINQISPFATLQIVTEGPTYYTQGAHITLTLLVAS